jgi:hypothetical protein
MNERKENRHVGFLGQKALPAGNKVVSTTSGESVCSKKKT